MSESRPPIRVTSPREIATKIVDDWYSGNFVAIGAECKSDLIDRVAETLDPPTGEGLPPHVHGCRDHGCVVERPTGQATNGGCRCTGQTLRNYIAVLKHRVREAEKREADLRKDNERPSKIVFDRP